MMSTAPADTEVSDLTVASPAEGVNDLVSDNNDGGLLARSPLPPSTGRMMCSLHAQKARQRHRPTAARALGQVAAGTSKLIASVDVVCDKKQGLFAAWRTAGAPDIVHTVAVEGARSRACLCQI
jgi:hypothetical protein